MFDFNLEELWKRRKSFLDIFLGLLNYASGLEVKEGYWMNLQSGDRALVGRLVVRRCCDKLVVRKKAVEFISFATTSKDENRQVLPFLMGDRNT